MVVDVVAIVVVVVDVAAVVVVVVDVAAVVVVVVVVVVVSGSRDFASAFQKKNHDFPECLSVCASTFGQVATPLLVQFADLTGLLSPEFMLRIFTWQARTKNCWRQDSNPAPSDGRS